MEQLKRCSTRLKITYLLSTRCSLKKKRKFLKVKYLQGIKLRRLRFLSTKARKSSDKEKVILYQMSSTLKRLLNLLRCLGVSLKMEKVARKVRQ